MAKNKFTIDFDEFEILQKKLDEIGGEATKRAVNSALKATGNLIARKTAAAMQRHIETGETIDALIREPVVIWKGDTAETGVGFEFPEGLPSIFIMYGTQLYGQPHVTPDRNLYNAVYGSQTRKEIQTIQKEAFYKVVERVMKQ